jgi:rare lipoprotein A
VKINDRGPYHGSRIIDLSKAAATKLGIVAKGTGKVCIARV